MIASLLLLAPRYTSASPVVRVERAMNTVLNVDAGEMEEKTTAGAIIDNRYKTDSIDGRRLASTVCPTTCANLARACGTGGTDSCSTTQTNTLTHSGTWDSGRGNDGDLATVFQTTGNGYREWRVDFETSYNVVEDVIVTNLNASPYRERLSGAKLDVLDLNGDIVASRTLTGDAGAQTYVFSERPIGSSVRISKTVAGGANLHAREVEVYGFATAQTQISGYDSYSTGGCAGRNELGQTTGGTLQACADACNADLTCVSFEYAKTGTSCQRSTSCDHVSMTVNNLEDPMNFYLKLPAGRSPSKRVCQVSLQR